MSRFRLSDLCQQAQWGALDGERQRELARHAERLSAENERLRWELELRDARDLEERKRAKA